MRRRLEEHLGSRREAEPADRSTVDVGPTGEVVDRCRDIGLPRPAHALRAAAALAAAALVVEENAVAVPVQHQRVAPNTVAVAAGSVHEHDRGAVPGREVPASERDAVARSQRHVLVRTGKWPRVDGVAWLLGQPDRAADRDDDEEQEHGHGECGQRRPRPAPPTT